jgi:hypothetical protein
MRHWLYSPDRAAGMPCFDRRISHAAIASEVVIEGAVFLNEDHDVIDVR